MIQNKAYMIMLMEVEFNTDGISPDLVIQHFANLSEFTHRFDKTKLMLPHIQELIALVAKKDNNILVRTLALNTLIGEGAIIPERMDKINKFTK